jgi:hypothetical protein
MTVNVRSFILSGGGNRPVTSFADLLTGVDRPFLIGNNWFTQFTSDSGVAMLSVAPELNIGGAGLIWGDGSAPNLNACNIGCYPSIVNRPAVVAGSVTRGEFAELTLVSRPIPGNSAGIGPSVLMNPGSDVQYLIQMESVNTNTVLFRKDSGAYTVLVANCFANAPGDVVRLESRYVTGFPELRVYQNGVLKSTFLDNSGLGPPSGGQFGMFLSGVFTGQIVVKNFNGGLL